MSLVGCFKYLLVAETFLLVFGQSLYNNYPEAVLRRQGMVFINAESSTKTVVSFIAKLFHETWDHRIENEGLYFTCTV